MLLLSSKAGGTGLNIIGANRLVLMDPGGQAPHMWCLRPHTTTPHNDPLMGSPMARLLTLLQSFASPPAPPVSTLPGQTACSAAACRLEPGQRRTGHGARVARGADQAGAGHSVQISYAHTSAPCQYELFENLYELFFLPFNEYPLTPFE